jgi:pimeloyl-ACP methyl ester carboxylesterase
MLIAGKVKEYQKHFWDRHCQDPFAFTVEDREVYANAYNGSGALRCALNVYRAFERDAVQNKQRVKEKGKCNVRCLTLWGAASWMGREEAMKMSMEYYQGAAYAEVEESGHWIAEEQPLRFVDAVLEWLDKDDPGSQSADQMVPVH